MPRSPTTYVLPPGTTPQAPNTTIGSAMFNAAMDDIATTFNTAQPIAFGGTGATSVITAWDALDAIGADIATSGTINLTTATGPNLTLTGVTTVTTVTLAEGNMRFVRANAAFQLTASANLIINGSASSNYTTTAGDLLVFIGGAASVVRVWAISGSVQAASLAEVLAGVVSNKYVSPSTAYLPTGFLYGLTLTTAGGDPTNDIVIAAGSARDASDSYNYLLGSAYTKQTDTAWALGSAAGSLDTGSIGNNRYAIWGIGRSDTRVCDVLTSLSFSAPTMPANYDFKVLIGEFTRTGGVNGTPLWYGPRRAVTGYDGITLGQSVASTSGTSVDFTGIPVWAKRVNVMWDGVSTTGTSNPLFQLGVSSGPETSSYLAGSAYAGASPASATYTTGFGMPGSAAGNLWYGTVTFSLMNPSTNLWIASGVMYLNASGTYFSFQLAGRKALAGPLDRIRNTTLGGTDTFDAGAININWE
jgi:hypothetical protein